MGLSSNTLIQQTSFVYLKKILKGKSFKVSYSVEYFNKVDSSAADIEYEHVFPMICFSEIHISSLHNHLYRYGDCIIGIKKEWAVNNGLNQVHYYQQTSILTKSLFETYYYYYNKVCGKTIEQTEIHKEYMKMFYHLEYQVAFSKNYSGKVESTRYKDDNYCFAEEKEWRFVPENPNTDRPLSLQPKKFEENKLKFQEEIGKEKLLFNLNDIYYIVVETDEQKLIIRDLIYKEDEDILINIFTNKEIMENFIGYKNPSIKEYDLVNQISELRSKNDTPTKTKIN